MDLETLNVLLNDPKVLPHVAPGFSDIQVTWCTPENGCFTFGDERGAILLALVHNDQTRAEWHWITPHLSGPQRLALGKATVRAAFTQFGVRTIMGLVPRDYRAARHMSRALGARPAGEETDVHGRVCVKYVLERDSWVASSDQSSAASGPSSQATHKPKHSGTQQTKLRRRAGLASTI